MGSSPTKVEIKDWTDRFKRDGYVVIHDAVDRTLLQDVKRSFDVALKAKVERSRLKPVDTSTVQPMKDHGQRVGIIFNPQGSNHDVNRWNMKLPSELPFLDERLIANVCAMAVVCDVLGPDVVGFLLASDIAYPGSGLQNFHRDSNMPTITVGIPLVDFTEHNGPLEIWPGTHRTSAGAPYSHDTMPSDLESYRLVTSQPPVRVLAPAGSVIVRDQRAIHRGSENHTQTPRSMLSMFYSVAPSDVPAKSLHSLLGGAARALRHVAIRGDGRAPYTNLMRLGNRLGVWYESMGCTDRYGDRRIPEHIWDGFSDSTRRMLRYATVQSQFSDPMPTSRSIRGSVEMLRFTKRAVARHMKSSRLCS